jgi:hypothetical protein
LCLFFISNYLRHQAEAKASATTMLCLLLIASAIFIGLDPGNYPNPVKGFWSAYADQQRSLEVQKGIPAKRHPLRSISERVRAMADLTAFHPAVFGVVVTAVLFTFISAPRWQPLPVIALWWVLAFAIVTAWLPFARPRYALPVITPSIILVAGASERVFAWLRRKSSAAATSSATASSS